MKRILITILVLTVTALNTNAQLGGFKKLKNKVVKTKTTADQPNNGISSPMHEKYMGKIVFGNTAEAIALKNEKEDQFITKATWGDEIRFRVYMDNSLLNYLKSQTLSETHGRYKVKFYLNDIEIGWDALKANQFTSDNKRDYTTFRGALKSPGDKTAILEREFARFLLKEEAKFTPGEHKLRIDFHPYQSYPDKYEGPVVASGELMLTMGESLVDPNDEKVCLPKAQMKDAVLEASIVKAFNSKGWDEQMKEVRIISSKWNIV